MTLHNTESWYRHETKMSEELATPEQNEAIEKKIGFTKYWFEQDQYGKSEIRKISDYECSQCGKWHSKWMLKDGQMTNVQEMERNERDWSQKIYSNLVCWSCYLKEVEYVQLAEQEAHKQ